MTLPDDLAAVLPEATRVLAHLDRMAASPSRAASADAEVVRDQLHEGRTRSLADRPTLDSARADEMVDEVRRHRSESDITYPDDLPDPGPSPGD